MMIDRRLLVLPALVALAARNADAFTPANFHARTVPSNSVRFSMVSTETDVSVEYDSAARLAYKDWCAKFGKEASATKFETFKANYEAITVANVSAAKKARDDGVDRPKDLELNEFGDMSEKEYMEMQSGEAAPTPEVVPEKSALESVMEASMAQSDASSALAEAADALAEEEEQLAEALGLESIDDLEEAIDAIQGIDSEGVEVDTSDSREIRVRGAYMDWCKEYGKEPDEARFPTFSSNFLAMEEYANENGREMVLNKYADCTEEEYRQLTQTAAPAPELVVEKSVEKEPVVKEPEAPKKEEPKAVAPEEPKKEEPKKEEPKAEAKVEKPKPVPKAPAPKPEPVKELSLEEEAIMQAKAAREAEAAQIARRRELDEQAAQIEREKAAAAMKKQQPVVVPTPPKTKPVESSSSASDGGNIFSSLFQSAPKKAETPIAKKETEPAKDDKATAEARLKAAGAVVAKQRKAQIKAIKTANAPPAKEEAAPTGILASLFGSSEKAPEKPVAPVEPTPPTPVKADKPKANTSNPFSFLQSATEKPKARVAQESPKVVTPPKKPDIEMAPNAMTEALNSFFGTSSKAPTPSASPVPEPAPETSKPKPQQFNLFGSKPAAKKVQAKPAAPKPTPVRKASPTLSLFGGAAPKPAPKAPPAPVSAPAPKGSGTFSLFSSPPPAPKVEAAPTPVTKKPAPAFGSFFGGSAPKPAQKAPEQPKPVEKEAPKGSGTFSLFGGGAPSPAKSAPVAQKPPVVKKTVVKKASVNGVAGIGGFGSFGAPKKAVKQPARAAGTISVTKQARGPGTISISSPKKITPPPAPVAKKTQGSGTFSIFGGGAPKPAPQAPAPVSTPTPKGSGTFSIFGGGGATKKAAPAPVAEPIKPKAVAKPVGGGFFGGAKNAAPKVANDGIPIVSNFKQNSDGSITGNVRNSKSFRNGTEITTSPVRRGAKAGDVVTTSSGSKYRLE